MPFEMFEKKCTKMKVKSEQKWVRKKNCQTFPKVIDDYTI